MKESRRCCKKFVGSAFVGRLDGFVETIALLGAGYWVFEETLQYEYDNF